MAKKRTTKAAKNAGKVGADGGQISPGRPRCAEFSALFARVRVRARQCDKTGPPEAVHERGGGGSPRLRICSRERALGVQGRLLAYSRVRARARGNVEG